MPARYHYGALFDYQIWIQIHSETCFRFTRQTEWPCGSKHVASENGFKQVSSNLNPVSDLLMGLSFLLILKQFLL